MCIYFYSYFLSLFFFTVDENESDNFRVDEHSDLGEALRCKEGEGEGVGVAEKMKCYQQNLCILGFDKFGM